MRSLLRPSALFVLFTYLALSAVPFAPLLFGRPVENAAGIGEAGIVSWLAIWAVLARPGRFHWLLLPAFLLLPVELYLQVYFNQGISVHHLGILIETSPRESLEFLGNKVWLLPGIVLVALGWWAWSWKAALGIPALDWKKGSRWIVIALLSAALGISMYGDRFGVEGGPARAASSLPKLPAWAHVPFASLAFEKSWPFGLGIRGHELWKERRYLAELAGRSGTFAFGAQQAGAGDLPQVVIMVIGESSRYDRWSLNGYRRETNPLLKNEANLVSLSDVVTAVSATRLSVPVLVSRKPARMSLQAGFAEKSFLTAFREAGFKTWWLSNQMTFGQFDTPVSVFAKEADVSRFLNLGGFSPHSGFDEVLLGPLQAALQDGAAKKLIVLHTLGSHWNYSHRHPEAYDRWQPSLHGVPNPAYNDRAVKERLNNSYDNSILYTDWFLSEVIARLKAQSQMALMMYVSDHGQTLYDGSCGYAFHGHNTQFEFHVPALVWYSDLYRATHPSKVHHLLRNKRARLATENVFHTLLDMADIRYDDEQLERSFVSKRFRPHKRYVDSYGWTDYDNATFKGDCREVIDRGTPLKQEQ